jgi:hypothetical protein
MLAAETVAAAFTHHHAVTLRLEVVMPVIDRGREMWKLNTSKLDDEKGEA